MREPIYIEDYAKLLLHLANARLNPLRLGRTDSMFLEGMHIHGALTQGLTQPQVDLIRTLVKKYTRQLRKYNIDASR